MIMKYVDNLKKKMEWYDFSLLKLAVFFSTLFLVTVWPGFLKFVLGIDWYWYLVLAIVVSVPVMRKMLS